MTKQPTIILLSCGLVVGVAISSWVPWYGVLLSGALAAVWQRQLGVGAVIGAALIALHPLEPPADDLAHLAGRKVVISGTVVDYPAASGDKQTFILRGSSESHSGMVRVSAPAFPVKQVGDVLEISGRVERPRASPNFDFRSYLAAQGIHSQINTQEIHRVHPSTGLTKLRGTVREEFRHGVHRALPEPAASFTLGILLGDKSGLSDSVQTAFQRTGLTHILALSGFNISILVLMGVKAIGRRPLAIMAILGGILVFIVLAGPSASVIRAGLMGGYLLIGQVLGRPQLAIHACILTLAVMLTITPWALRYDVGFQLSFCATLGILLLEPSFAKWLRLRSLGLSGLPTTLAATIATLPIIVWQFGTLSIVAPFANLLVIPFVPWLMLAGFIVGVTAMVSPTLAEVAGLLPGAFTIAVISVIDHLSNLPVAALALPVHSGWALLMVVVCVAGAVYLRRRYA